MKTKLNGWQRIGIVISAFWIIFVFGLLVKDLMISDFEQETSNSCPTLRESPLYSWYDAKTNKKISVYRENEKSMLCDDAKQRVREFVLAYENNEIIPIVKIEFGFLIGALTIPILSLWVLTYFIVWVTKWIIVGFRK